MVDVILVIDDLIMLKEISKSLKCFDNAEIPVVQMVEHYMSSLKVVGSNYNKHAY